MLLSEDGIKLDSVTLRKNTFSAQAPQSFILDDIISAHDEIRNRPNKYENMVDACTIYNTLGRPVYLVEGNRGNIKITTPEDVFMYRALIQYKESQQAFEMN